MAKRRNEEARVLAYFTSAPIEKAELMLGLVRDQVKQRIASPAGGVLGQATVKKRRVRKDKVARPAAGSQLEFKTAEMERAQ